MIRWLQWSLVDPRTHLGGGEVHALCLAHELKRHGVETHYSTDPRDLFANDEWDVIQTHGAALPTPFAGRIRAHRPLRLHTLHGTSLGQMLQMRRLFSMGKLKAFRREWQGCLEADLVASVHPNLCVLPELRRRKIPIVVHGNGYNAFEILPSYLGASAQLEPQLRKQLMARQPFWIFAGRGNDKSKGARLLENFLKRHTERTLVAAPGAGLAELPNLFKSGPLSPMQLRELMELAEGLIQPSYYETGPLVAMEALALGLRVISTPTGIVYDVHREALQGISWIPRGANPSQIEAALEDTLRLGDDSSARAARAQHNRGSLDSWAKVADRLWAATQPLLANR
jgi:glycosyltransferase involved in cell wall biosynthesis